MGTSMSPVVKAVPEIDTPSTVKPSSSCGLMLRDSMRTKRSRSAIPYK